jgi:hypothetical protein
MARFTKPGAKWKAAILAGCFAGLLGTGSAQAFIVSPGNNPQANEQNILLTGGSSGTTVTGETNQTHDLINFFGSESLTVPSNGQARIVSTDGNGFQAVTVEPVSATATFQDLIANITLTGTGQRSADLEVTVTFADSTTDSITIPGAIDQGGNFFTIVAGPGEQFRNVTLEVNNGDPEGTVIDTLAQIRISGVAACPTCPPARVPEPGTLAVLGGSLLGFVGFTARRLRRR